MNGFDLSSFIQTYNIRGNGVKIIHDFVSKVGVMFQLEEEIGEGDIVFFDNTYDRNRDRKVNDPLTHIGIIQRIYPDQTIEFLHHMQGGIQTGYLNLKNPDRHQMGDRAINTFLRRRTRGDKKGTRYMASHLFASFGSLWLNRPSHKEIVALDLRPLIP